MHPPIQRGPWYLDGGQAMRLAPREARYLRATHGTLWVTLAPPLGAMPAPARDIMVQAGERLLVQPGQTAVISSAGSRRSSVSFDWQAVQPARRTASALDGLRLAALQWMASWGLAAAR